MASRPIRLAILLSAGGTTLQNLLDRIAAKTLDAEIVLVISNNTDAYGLQRAAKANIATMAVNRKEAGSREEFSRRIFDACRTAHADLVCMAGFLQLIQIPDDFAGRVMNVHPALIPAFCGAGFYGHHVHEGVLAYGAKITGCTVHFADNQYDHGPIILQRAVEVRDDDTAESLAARVFKQECAAYPEAIRLFAEGKLTVKGRCVAIASDRSG
jgi:formyltetrahydrofolate-dependent phosphoribosylglycinamide formyltransferase